jgi:large subunit ribosomal protein L24
MANKLKKGDKVLVIAGRDKGKVGAVLEIDWVLGWAKVEGIHVQKRNVKAGARQSMPEGGVIEKTGKIHVSNLKFHNDKVPNGTRVGFDLVGDKKVRVARGRHGESIQLDA